jgi:hypothetical protein
MLNVVYAESRGAVNCNYLFTKVAKNELSLIPCGLYYKHITIVNYNSRIVKKLGASLTDDARAVIYNCHMFIAQATGRVS